MLFSPRPPPLSLGLQGRRGLTSRLAPQASREHYCIHPHVSKQPSRDQECEKLMQEDRGCSYFHNARKLLSRSSGKVFAHAARGQRRNICFRPLPLPRPLSRSQSS